MSCPLVHYQAYNHLTLGPTALGLGDYKPDIALMDIYYIWYVTMATSSTLSLKEYW